MARGVAAAWPEATVDLVPMADGGEGTVEALVTATRGSFREATVTGPLGDPVIARFGLLGDGRTGPFCWRWRRPPGWCSSPRPPAIPMHRRATRGTGEELLRRPRLDLGCQLDHRRHRRRAPQATAARAWPRPSAPRLLDESGRELPPGGCPRWPDLDRIDPSRLDPRLPRATIRVACDVTNPLCGPAGASAVYGPQKGAMPAMVAELDSALTHYARVIARDLGRTVADLPGAGAAGGLGAGLVAFAGGVLTPGIDLVIDAVGLADRLRGADLCLTGEGALDASSAFGKTAVGVARLARSLGVPCLALAGMIGPGARRSCSTRGSTPS